jgi:hypothetical protein
MRLFAAFSVAKPVALALAVAAVTASFSGASFAQSPHSATPTRNLMDGFPNSAAKPTSTPEKPPTPVPANSATQPATLEPAEISTPAPKKPKEKNKEQSSHRLPSSEFAPILIAQNSEPSTAENEEVIPVSGADSGATNSPPISTPEPTASASQELWPECDAMYLNYIRGLPKAKQAGEMEMWWMFQDTYYWQTKKNEFEYKEQKPKKTVEFEKALAETPKLTTIVATVKLKPYDFKKKGFPVDINLEPSTKTLDNFSTGNMFGGGLGSLASAYVNCGGMRIESPVKGKAAPSTARFKLTNIDRLKFFPVSEEKAKPITMDLNNNRTTTMYFRFELGKTSLVKQKHAQAPEMITEAKVVEVQLGENDSKVSFKP